MFQPDLKFAIGKFAAAVHGLELGLPEAVHGLEKTIAEKEEQLRTFVESKLAPSQQEDKKIYRFCNEGANGADRTQRLIGFYREFFFAKKELERIKASSQDLPRLFFLALGGAYDAYLNILFKSLLYLRPELLPQPESISAEESQELLVESEIKSLLGRDHGGHLAWLETKFGILAADLETPPEFLELMARRGLHLHNNGAASAGYLELCRRHGFPVENLVVGSQMGITQEYFAAACDMIYETGIKLGHLLWRIVAPQQASKANAALQDLTFGLIQERRYKPAQGLLTFANKRLQKYNDENNRLVFLLNGALASYLANEKNECRRMLSSEDWGSHAEILQLANSVLTERFQHAADLMRRIGKDNRPTKGEYLRWPLFEEFRKTPEFILAFNEIFGEVTLAEAEVRPFERAVAS